MNFIKKVFVKKIDESVHKQFIRFGKGDYKKRALLSLWKTGNVKVKGSFEFANDFVLFAANHADLKLKGTILSKHEIGGLSGKKKEGKIVYEVDGFSSADVKKTAEHVYCFLLSGEGNGISVKIKGKLPKPGKGEDKVDEKFCQMELDEKYFSAVKEDFFWDLPDCKKASIDHTFSITDIVMPKGETDYAKIREMAKRKGKVIRAANVDGKEVKSEVAFEA